MSKRQRIIKYYRDFHFFCVKSNNYGKFARRALSSDVPVAALSIKYLLPKNFHDRAKNSEAISAEDDWQNIKTISEFTNRADCAFLYTLIQDDGGIYITSSSATKKELDQNVEVRYFTHFKEVDENFYRVFDSDKAYFSPMRTGGEHSGLWRFLS